MALNRMGELFVFDGKTDHVMRTSISQFNQTFFPQGEQYLQQFELGDTAVWHYEVEGVRIIKSVLPVWQRNIVGVRYDIEGDPGTIAAHATHAVRESPRFPCAAVGV